MRVFEKSVLTASKKCSTKLKSKVFITQVFSRFCLATIGLMMASKVVSKKRFSCIFSLRTMARYLKLISRFGFSLLESVGLVQVGRILNGRQCDYLQATTMGKRQAGLGFRGQLRWAFLGFIYGGQVRGGKSARTLTRERCQ
jgi:hypothetical protein